MIDYYCIQNSSKPSELCQELEKVTKAEVPMSQMLSGPLVASFVGFLIRTLNPKKLLEFGTYTGYSALSMAENCSSDAEILTLDVDAKAVDIGKKFWARSPYGKKIRSIVGPASDTMLQVKGPIDFVFIDADKTGYLNYLKYSLSVLSPNGIIVADNCLYGGMVVDASTQDRNAQAIQEFNRYLLSREDLYKTLIPVRDGLFLIRK